MVLARCTVGRMTVTLDEELLAEAQKALCTSTKAETIREALRQALRRQGLKDALKHRGRVGLDLDRAELAKLRKQG